MSEIAAASQSWAADVACKLVALDADIQTAALEQIAEEHGEEDRSEVEAALAALTAEAGRARASIPAQGTATPAQSQPAAPLVRRDLSAVYARQQAEAAEWEARVAAARANAVAVAPAVAKPEPAPQPAPEPPRLPAEPEPPASSPEPEVAKPPPPPSVLNAGAPFDTAKVFAQRHCQVDGATVVWYWQGQFWRWNGKFYAPEPDEIIRGHVYA